MSFFSGIIVRSNGNRVLASWWNIIRTQLLLFEAVFGGGLTGEAQFTINDNETGPTSITDMVVDKDSYQGACIAYNVLRRDDTEGRREIGLIWLTYDPETTAWSIARETKQQIGALMGLTLTVTSAGQVQYASDSMGGASYSGKMRWKIINTFDIET